jgi:hypothetical protein
VFALLAMIYVPAPSQKHPFSRAHYRFIFSQDETGIAFFQLLVNVAFAALLGAILATIVPKIATGVRRLPKRVWLGLGGLALIALFIAAGVSWSNFAEAAVNRARSDEDYADELLSLHYSDTGAKFTLQNAARNWRFALRFQEASRVENRIKALEQRAAQDWRSDPVVDLSGLPDQAQVQAAQAANKLEFVPDQPGQFATAGDFAKYATKLREKGLNEVPPLKEPTTSHVANVYPWKTNIVTTVFWIGEPRSSENPKAHEKSAWDANWIANYGGVDTPDSSARRNYLPTAFIPRQNPFYCALPYNDVTHGQFKQEAPLVIPWFKLEYRGPGQSVCRDRWLAIRKGNRTCYAEWEDCGPFLTDHFQYVFGNERPKPNVNHGAGLDVSPAVRDYLGLAPTDVIDWQFVDVRDVPPGPWRSYGENNHFVIARRQMEQNSQENDESPKSQQH